MAQDLAAEQVDLYLTGEPPELVKEKIARAGQSRRPRPQGALWHSPARDCA